MFLAAELYHKFVAVLALCALGNKIVVHCTSRSETHKYTYYSFLLLVSYHDMLAA